MEGIEADLLATGRLERVEQNLDLRFSDTYTQQVPRLRMKTKKNISYNCISLWSESVYMLKVDGQNIQVPDTNAWNPVIIEARFDLQTSWARASSVSYSARVADGVMFLPPIFSQSACMDYPIYIPTIARILDALLDQASHRVTNAESFPEKKGNRPINHLNTCVRYLHLEKPVQRARVLPELAERNRESMEAIMNKFQRKPLLRLASLSMMVDDVI